MPPIVSTIEIARPPDEVFAYVTDPARFPEWQLGVVRVQVEAGPAAGVGSRFVTTRRITGAGKPLLPAVRRQTQKVAPTSYRRLKDRLERGGEQRTAP